MSSIQVIGMTIFPFLLYTDFSHTLACVSRKYLCNSSSESILSSVFSFNCITKETEEQYGFYCVVSKKKRKRKARIFYLSPALLFSINLYAQEWFRLCRSITVAMGIVFKNMEVWLVLT